MTQDVVDLTSDNDDPAPENRSEEQEDHSLVKKLLSTIISWLYGFVQLMSLTRFQKAMARHGLGEIVSLEATPAESWSECTSLCKLAGCVVSWTRALITQQA